MAPEQYEAAIKAIIEAAVAHCPVNRRDALWNAVLEGWENGENAGVKRGELKSGKLKTREVAEMFGVKPETVIRWIRSGELKGIDVSSRPGLGKPRFLVDRSAVEDFEKRRAVKPPIKPSPRRRRKQPGDYY